jgi:septal ring factor EnvC (AmiA/AmiB activator)
MKRRLLPLYLFPHFFAFAVPALVADTLPPSAASAPAETSAAELKQQLADAQDRLATALHSYSLLDDANSQLKAETAPLRERIRQLQDQVADLAAENARLRTRLALLAPLPGSPQRSGAAPRSP